MPHLNIAKPILVSLNHNRWSWCFGALLLIALVLFVYYEIGFVALCRVWQSVPITHLLIATSAFFLSYVLRAVRTIQCFQTTFEDDFFGALRLTLIHNLALIFMPMRLGELFFPALLKREYRVSFTTATTALVFFRLLDGVTLFGVMLIAIALANKSLLGFLSVGLWWCMPIIFYPIMPWLLARLGSKTSLSRLVIKLRLAIPQAPTPFLIAYVLTVMAWLAKFYALSLVLYSLTHLDIAVLLMGAWGAEASAALPIHGIAGAGTYEMGISVFLMGLGTSKETALIGAVSLHVFVLGMALLSSVIAWVLPRKRRQIDARQESQKG